MPETIYIGQDMATAETKVLFDKQDFVNLIWDKLGRDAGMYLEDMLEETYQCGYDKGYDDGHEAGYETGYYFGRDD